MKKDLGFYSILAESIEFAGFQSYGVVFFDEGNAKDEIAVMQIVEPLMQDYISGYCDPEDYDDEDEYEAALGVTFTFEPITYKEYIEQESYTPLAGVTKAGTKVYFSTV